MNGGSPSEIATPSFGSQLSANVATVSSSSTTSDGVHVVQVCLNFGAEGFELVKAWSHVEYCHVIAGFQGHRELGSLLSRSRPTLSPAMAWNLFVPSPNAGGSAA